MQRITRIGPLSLGKLMGGLGAVFGLFIGMIFTVVSLFGAAMMAAGSSGAESLFGIVFGIGAIFVFPILYGGFSFLQGVVVAAIANVAMRVFGGLEIQLSD